MTFHERNHWKITTYPDQLLNLILSSTLKWTNKFMHKIIIEWNLHKSWTCQIGPLPNNSLGLYPIWWSLNLFTPVKAPENQHVFKSVVPSSSQLQGHSTNIALANNKFKGHHWASTKPCIQSYSFSCIQLMVFSPVCSKGIEPADSGGELDFLSNKTNKGAK